MAKLTDTQWAVIRQDYEVHGLSYGQIVDKHNTSKGSVSRRANKENWIQGKVEHLVADKVNAIRDLQEVERRVERLEPIVQKSIDMEVNERLAQERLFTNSAMMNQQIANDLIDRVEVSNEPVTTAELNQHSQLTARNKETVLGKQPTTAVQVNNNIDVKEGMGNFYADLETNT